MSNTENKPKKRESFIVNCLPLIQLKWEPEPIQTVIWLKGGYILDSSPVYPRANTQDRQPSTLIPTTNLESLINLASRAGSHGTYTGTENMQTTDRAAPHQNQLGLFFYSISPSTANYKDFLFSCV